MKYLSSLSAAVIVILIIITTNSCTSNIEKENGNGIVMDVEVNIMYKNNNGKNLLNPSMSHAYDPENITVYWLENGRKIKPIDTTITGEINKMWAVRTTSKGHYILNVLTPPLSKSKLLPNNGIAHDGITTSFIELPTGETDTLKARLVRGDGGIILTKVWYNSQLKWKFPKNGQYDGYFFITVIKPDHNQANSQH